MARLTDYEKQALDFFMINNIDNINGKTTYEIAQLVNINKTVSYQSIAPSIKRIANTLQAKGIYCTCTSFGAYTPIRFEKADYVFTNNATISKEKNILSFAGCEELKYDFITKTFNIELKDVLNATRILDDEIMYMLEYEWLFNYTNSLNIIRMIHRKFEKECYEKMPKGLIDVINENNGFLDIDQFYNFILKTRYGKYYKMVETISNLCSLKYLNTFLEDYSLPFLEKIMRNTLYNGRFNLRSDIYDLLCNYHNAKKAELTPILDDNRDFAHNIQIIHNCVNAEKNKVLGNRLRKLNFINGLEIENTYIVVVPQTQEDKQAEGKMQNNCVGYYYDDSILRGENFIYFIRKINSPDKSYITCRFNKDYGFTTESRKVNNTPIDNNKETQIIHDIDKIIQKHINEL